MHSECRPTQFGSPAMTIAAPSSSQCWSGLWRDPEPSQLMWAIAAAGRTVSALPLLHPWRLGDTKGSRRTILWAAAPGTGEGVAVFTETSRESSLPLGSGGPDIPDHDPRWMGGMVRLPGAWLPALAILPRSERDFDDPGTRWSTESLDFAARHTVHAESTRYAADILTPHMMALVLDSVPTMAAVTISGDAIHVWAKHVPETASSEGLVQRTLSAASQLKHAMPHFVLADYPDHSPEVEADQALKGEAAATYRAHRRLGRSDDPTLQRIYDQARADWEARDVSSSS